MFVWRVSLEGLPSGVLHAWLRLVAVTVARPRLRALYLNMTGLLHVFLPQMRYFR